MTEEIRYRAVVRVIIGSTAVEAGRLVPKGVEVPAWMVEQGKVEED